MIYRREIDGLRAFAVIPVILFHARLPPMSGGFVGVDVFFVISGYLITTLLLGDIDAGRFSLTRFYERRARRILPALFVVLLACLPFAYAIMLPQQLEDFAVSLAATAMFLSNFHFLNEIDYFRPEAELQPLLHTWSLAVEEQYYLFFPPLLAIAFRGGRRVAFFAIFAVTLASLALAEWSAESDPERNFFFTPSRLWEIGAGALVAFWLFGRNARPHEGAAVAGLAGILAACVLYDPSIPFPSLYTLLPVIGTLLVILHATPATWTGRLLGHRCLVGIGLISYSAYLWHQPLFAFARLGSLDAPGMPLMIGLSLASLGLAALSWRFVEQPFRRKTPLLPRQRTLFMASLAGLAGFVGLAAIGYTTKGLPARLPPEIGAIVAMSHDKSPHQRTCDVSRNTSLPEHPVPGCTGFLRDGRADVLILGDSHAGAIATALQETLAEDGIASYATAFNGCPGIIGLERVRGKGGYRCDRFNREAVAFARSIGIRTLVIVSRLPAYETGQPFDNGEGGRESLMNPVDAAGAPPARSEDERRRRFRDALVAGLEELTREFEVILVEPIPEIGWHVPERLARCRWQGNSIENCAITVSHANYLERIAPLHAALDRVTSPRLIRARLDSLFCGEDGRCAATRNGMPLYFDDDHLAHSTGARLLAPYIGGLVRSTLQPIDAKPPSPAGSAQDGATGPSSALR